MKASICTSLSAGFIFSLAILPASEARGEDLILGSTGCSNGQFTFSFSAIPNVKYVIFRSTNLMDWTAISTNESSASNRMISFPASEERTWFRVERAPIALFSFALAASASICISTPNLVCDSYDNDLGPYDVTQHKNRGDILAGSNISLLGPNTTVLGHVITSPTGTVTLVDGSIGDLDWVSAGSKGIEPGWWLTNGNLAMPDVTVPFTGGYLVPSSGTNWNDGTFYLYYLGSGNYQLNNLNLSAGAGMYVAGDAVLYVPGDVIISGTGGIVIETNATLKIYCGGSAILSGHGCYSPAPSRLLFFGLPTCSSISISGSWPLKAGFYAPQANINLSGNNFCGSLIGKSITLRGGAVVHYDESLGRRSSY